MPAPSPTPRPLTHSYFLLLLESTLYQSRGIPADSEMVWSAKVLDLPWWNTLKTAGKEEVMNWAEQINHLRHGAADEMPKVPPYLRGVQGRAKPDDSPGTSAGVDKADELVHAMRLIAKMALDKRGQADRALGKSSSARRAIGHRMARIYGTTKDAWEAGRAWQ